MEFEIAKKLEKLPSNVKGNSLRSIKADNDGAQMIIVADAYGEIKSAVENYRMMTNADIAFRMRGKSIEVAVTSEEQGKSMPQLMEFAKAISFNSEDAMDVIEFWNKSMPLDGCKFVEMDMDQNRMKLVLSADDFSEALQNSIMEKLDAYNMGIVK